LEQESEFKENETRKVRQACLLDRHMERVGKRKKKEKME